MNNHKTIAALIVFAVVCGNFTRALPAQTPLTEVAGARHTVEGDVEENGRGMRITMNRANVTSWASRGWLVAVPPF